MGPTKAATTAIFLLVASMISSAANAELLTSYDLVGQDPAGDSTNFAAPGVAASPTISAARTDILDLEMANDGDVVHVKLNIGETPAGTGSYMYAVHFKVAGDPYFTCWTIAWIGGQTQQAEDTLGCSRFTGESGVGPTTRAEGVQVATEDEKSFVRWEVAKDEIGMEDADLPITDLFADTWFRGASNCCVGSTSQSPYLWNRADLAPDAGLWTYSMTPAAPPLSLSFAMEPKNATVGPAESLSVSLMPNLTGNGSVAFNWSIPDVPEGWNATFDVPNGTLTGGENVTHYLTILVPDDAANQTTNLTVLLTAENNLTISANLAITVDTTLAPPPLTTGPSGSANASASDNATAAAADGSGIPNLGIVASTIGIIAVAAALRARRKN